MAWIWRIYIIIIITVIIRYILQQQHKPYPTANVATDEEECVCMCLIWMFDETILFDLEHTHLNVPPPPLLNPEDPNSVRKYIFSGRL